MVRAAAMLARRSVAQGSVLRAARHPFPRIQHGIKKYLAAPRQMHGGGREGGRREVRQAGRNIEEREEDNLLLERRE